jgi:hypothetical protein
MATKPVKVLTDLLTRKQVIKQDLDGNILFRISGSLGNGSVSSSIPITASYFVGDGRYLTNISGSGGISEVYTTGNISGNGTIGNPIALQNFINLITVTASSGFSGNLYGTASYALTAAYAENSSGISANTANINYKKLRYKITGSFESDGYAEAGLPLTQYGSSSFPVTDLDYFVINIMVKESGSANWTNDIIAYELFISASQVYVGMYAPDISTSGSYKLLAINENPTAYDLA